MMSTFSVIAQSSTHVRLIYRNFYCLDMQCRPGRSVSVRDGAYSTFETNKVVECLNPIPNLQVILQLPTCHWRLFQNSPWDISCYTHTSHLTAFGLGLPG